jgi:hypothetical protein
MCRKHITVSRVNDYSTRKPSIFCLTTVIAVFKNPGPSFGDS